MTRSYDGPEIDGTVQYITEAPAWQGDGETVGATDPKPQGEETTTNVPDLDAVERPDVEGQSTLADWSPDLDEYTSHTGGEQA